MNNIGRIIIAIVCFGTASYFIYGVCFPRFRGFWGRTPVVCGWVSYTGIALFLGGAGFALVTSYGGIFFLVGIAGAIIAISGAILDKRAYLDGSAPRRPTSPERKGQGLRNFSPMPVLIFLIFFFF